MSLWQNPLEVSIRGLAAQALDSNVLGDMSRALHTITEMIDSAWEDRKQWLDGSMEYRVEADEFAADVDDVGGV